MALVPVARAAFASEGPRVTLIAHPSVSGSTLSVASARSIFGMRMTQWEDGSPVRVFVLPSPHPLHATFCKRVLDLYPYQLRQSWDRLVYSGLGQAPTEVDSEADMLRRVASTPGAVGYIQGSTNDARIKIMRVE